jgi:hypothetical protein
MDKEKKKEADNEIQNNHQELNAIQSDISVSVNSEDGIGKGHNAEQITPALLVELTFSL